MRQELLADVQHHVTAKLGLEPSEWMVNISNKFRVPLPFDTDDVHYEFEEFLDVPFLGVARNGLVVERLNSDDAELRRLRQEAEAQRRYEMIMQYRAYQELWTVDTADTRIQEAYRRASLAASSGSPVLTIRLVFPDGFRETYRLVPDEPASVFGAMLSRRGFVHTAGKTLMIQGAVPPQEGRPVIFSVPLAPDDAHKTIRDLNITRSMVLRAVYHKNSGRSW